MGSYVQTRSTAIDNRLAVTDNALGISSSGTNNNLTLGGNIFDFTNVNAASSGGGTANTGSLGGGINLNILDGGAIDGAFNFAAFSLSETLAYLIDGNKKQQETTTYTVDKIGDAIQQASNISAAAAAASAAAGNELQGNNHEFMKKAAVVAVAGALAWWLWKGRK